MVLSCNLVYRTRTIWHQHHLGINASFFQGNVLAAIKKKDPRNQIEKVSVALIENVFYTNWFMVD